jgi:predicted hydrocarbon binding protein
MSAEPPIGVSGGAGQGETGYFFANKMGRIFYLALAEVTGGEAMNAILGSARMKDRLDRYPPNNFAPEFSFDELGQIQQALEELYGPSGGRELARRVGRACFRIGAEDLNPVLGLTDLAFRILPLRMRFKIGLEVLAHMFDRFSDHLVRLEEDERYFGWIVERCGVCWGRRSDAPCCDLAVGLLEEAIYWLSGGGSGYVEEVSCVAAGEPTCTILVGKRLVDRSLSMEG